LRTSSLILLVVLTAGVLTGCDDPFAPTLAPVPDEPSEAVLFDFRTSELRQPSAFDVISTRAVRTDQTSGWDFLVELDEGTFLFRPRSVVLDESSTAGLQRSSSGFEDLSMAPEGGYVTDDPVPVEEGAVYAARSRQQSAGCLRFLKLEVLAVDVEAGSLEVRFLGNPNCGRRTLVAGATGEEQEQ
jgi:hypothetical protein